jgi:hypothetical protein
MAGVLTATHRLEAAEFLQIDSMVASRLDPDPQAVPPDLLNLDTPENIAKNMGENGLLSYVASIQKALSPSKWLMPDQRDAIENSAVEAVYRLAKLSRIAGKEYRELEGALPRTSPDYPKAPWKERQQFLRLALPMIGYAQQEYYLNRLERQMLLLARSYDVMRQLKDRLQTMVDSLDTMMEGDAMAALGNTANILQLERPREALARDMLSVSLIGANQLVGREFLILHGKYARSCLAHFVLQGDFRKCLGPAANECNAKPVMLGDCGEFFKQPPMAVVRN